MSGLYFLYRIIPLLIFRVNDFTVFYLMIEAFLISMLALHCLVQPYKRRLHNQIDCLIFTILAVINGLSLSILMTSDNGKVKQVATSIQLVLIYLPLIYIAVFGLTHVVRKLRQVAKRRNDQDDDGTLLDSMYLPPLRDETKDETYNSHDFHQMK